MRDRDKLNAEVLQDLADRSVWDTRQRMFYEMRHHGLRRKNKPWPGASDVHFPLVDTTISELKPAYFQQLFATDLIAQFVPTSPQVAEFTTAAAQWFDHRIKQRTNLETEVLSSVDSMLMCGTGILKVLWDYTSKRLKYYTVDPQHFVVPAWTRDIADADRICHISVYSVDAYKRQKHLKQDKAILDQITGSYNADAGDMNTEAAKYEREGLTFPEQNKIIVWEVYNRCPDTGQWIICTYSPTSPDIDLRPPMKVPYNHGKPPFIAFNYEIKDPGFYSSRGVVELQAVFEAELTKLQNEKMDCMTLFNRPLYRAERDMPNTGNLRLTPGSILPYGIQPVMHQAPPISFDTQMNIMREIAQNRVSTPDFGLTQSLQNTERRTATEIQAIGGLYQQSSDLRMRIFRIALGNLYRMSWSILLQYDKSSLNYWYLDTAQEIPQEALHEQYNIQPTGSADGVNKQLLMQKAITRFQMFANDPYIDQGQLRKTILESDDATLVKRLYVDPQLTQSTQAEDQANEITFLRLGFPALVKDSDDHLIHIQTVMSYITNRADTGAPPEPAEGQFLEQHIGEHLEKLKEADPKTGRQVEQELKNLFAQMQEAVTQQAEQQNVESIEEPMAAMEAVPPSIAVV
jgi:hypothetical protein